MYDDPPGYYNLIRYKDIDPLYTSLIIWMCVRPHSYKAARPSSGYGKCGLSLRSFFLFPLRDDLILYYAHGYTPLYNNPAG